MNTRLYRESIRRHGVGATLFYGAYRAANRVTNVAVLNGLVLTPDRLDKRFLDDPRRKDVVVLDPEAMRPYVNDPENFTLGHDGIDLAKRRGDRCFAIFDGEVLASFGWSSTQPTPLIELGGDLVVHFDPAYAYIYNGFTRLEYRGQRLRAIGMAAACDTYTREGKKGLVLYVEASNFASLKSCYRIGYESFGRLGVLKVGEHYLYWASPTCRRYDFYVHA